MATVKAMVRIPQMRTVSGIADFMTRCLRKMASGELEIDAGYKLVQTAAVLRDTAMVARVENDIAALKQRLDTSGSGNDLIRVVPFPKAEGVSNRKLDTQSGAQAA